MNKKTGSTPNLLPQIMIMNIVCNNPRPVTTAAELLRSLATGI
jgi:hypothetical protein